MADTASPVESFGTRLRNLRKARGWSQEELARRTNRHWTYIGGLDGGERNPTLLVISELAWALAQVRQLRAVFQFFRDGEGRWRGRGRRFRIAESM